MVNVIDYMPGDTLLHRLNPVVKLGLAAAIIVGIFLSDTYVALLGFLALTLALGAYAGVVDRLFSLLKLLIPLALIMLVLQLAFMRDGNVVWGFITDTGLITGSKACLRLLGQFTAHVCPLSLTEAAPGSKTRSRSRTSRGSRRSGSLWAAGWAGRP